MKVKTYALELQGFEADVLEKVVSNELTFYTDRLGLKTLQGQATQELATATLALNAIERQLKRILALVEKAHKKAEGVTIIVH